MRFGGVWRHDEPVLRSPSILHVITRRRLFLEVHGFLEDKTLMLNVPNTSPALIQCLSAPYPTASRAFISWHGVGYNRSQAAVLYLYYGSSLKPSSPQMHGCSLARGVPLYLVAPGQYASCIIPLYFCPSLQQQQRLLPLPQGSLKRP